MRNNRPNPYPGPRAFQHGEALYGRERETAQLLDLLIAERVVLLYAPSGAGKTSLVQAALVPELEREGYRVFPGLRVSLRPAGEVAVANRYILSLLLSLEEALPPERRMALADLARISLDDYLARQPVPADDAWHGDALIFDQFEEILTVEPTDVAGKTQFFEQVGKALRDYNRWALFSMREEFIAGLDPYVRSIPARFDKGHRYRLDLLGLDAARLAMQGPARDHGVTFTNAAAGRLLENLAAVRTQGPDGAIQTVAGQTVEPVQLQVVCRRLWEGLAPDDPEIGVDDVEAVGDVESALRDYYAATVADVAGESSVRERSIRDWFDTQLITVQGIRGQVLQGPASSPAGREGLANHAVDLLVDAHLVRRERRRDATWLELAHDRLIEPVQRDNAQWRERHLSPLQRQAALWESAGRPAGQLLQGQALQEAEAWAGQHAAELEPYEAAYLAECREARDRLESERRQAQRIRRLAIVAGVVAVIALVAAVLAFLSNQYARREAGLSNSRELAAAAIAELGRDPERSILLANQALSVTYTSQAEDALRQALQASRIVRRIMVPGNRFYKVAYRPDGGQVAAAGKDGKIYLWPAGDDAAAAPRAWDGGGGEIYSLAFSPDGRTLATAHADGAARLWEAATGRLQRTLALTQTAAMTSRPLVLAVAFSPDGKRLATGANDGTLALWDPATGAQDPVAFDRLGGIAGVAFSPDGTRLATAGLDGQVLLWDAAAGGRPQAMPGGHTGVAFAVAFSPDGKRLASGGQDKIAIVWDVSGAAPARLLTLYGHSNSVDDVEFSANGACLATAAVDRTARLWDAATGQALLSLAGHTDWVNGLAFAPAAGGGAAPPAERCGARLATAAWDGTVRIWNIGPAVEGQTFAGQAGPVESVAFGPDASLLAAGSDDGTASIWDVRGDAPPRSVKQGGRVNRVALSPDGKLLATASWDGTARLWHAASGQPASEPLNGHAGLPVESVAFSPDGSRLATAGDDGSAALWEVPSGRWLAGLDHRAAAAAAGANTQDDKVYGAAFSPDGALVATTGADGYVILWDAAAGKVRRALQHGGQVYDAAFSPDGHTLASVSWDATAKLWDVASGRLLHTLAGHTDRIYGVQFSPDGKQVATSSGDGTARIWDVASGELLHTLPGPQFNSLSYSRDGRLLAVGGEDGTARVYLLDLAALRRLAAARLTRTWTPDECRTYLHVDRCPGGS